MNKSNLTAVVEAKSEYTKLLITYLKPMIYEALIVIYSSSVESAIDVHSIMDSFQKELSNIIKWNNEVIKNETERIKEACPFLEELITAVILANVKILTSIRVKKKKKQLKLTIPSTGTFIHSIYINIGKEVLKNPDSFDIELYNGDITRNYVIVGLLIDSSIENAIRSSIPLRHILDMSLPGNNDESESDSENEPESVDEPSDEPEPVYEPVYEPVDEPVDEPVAMDEPVPTDGLEPMDELVPTDEHKSHENSQTMMGGILSHSDDEDDVKEVSIHQSQPLRKTTFF